MELATKKSTNRSVGTGISRTRQLTDLVQIATLYHKEGLLTELAVSHPDHQLQRVRTLSIIASISETSARDILKIIGLLENESAWTFMRESSALKIFDESSFFNTATSFLNSEGDASDQNLLCLSFLQNFVTDDLLFQQQETMEKAKSLRCIARKFTKSARETCVTMFLKCAAVISTLSSFFPESEAFDQMKTLDVLDRYLSKFWNSNARQAQYHRTASRKHASQGWHLVHVAFMIQVQEMCYWRDRNKTSDENKDGESIVSDEDVRSTAHMWCHRVLVEFFAWIFSLRSKFERETTSSFLETCGEVVKDLNEKLAREIGCKVSEPIPGQLMASTLDLIVKKAPTMAEITYDETRMTPSLSEACRCDINWVVEDILMRGRWEQSPVLDDYSAFVKVSQTTERQRKTASLVRESIAGERKILPERTQNMRKRVSDAIPIEEIVPSPKRARQAAAVPEHPYHINGEVSDDHRRDEMLGTSKVQNLQTTDPADSALEAEGASNAIERLYELVLAWPIFPTLTNPDSQGNSSRDRNHCNTKGDFSRAQHTTAYNSSAPLDKQSVPRLRSPANDGIHLSLRRKIATDLLSPMDSWAEGHYDRYKNGILPDVTTAKNVHEYRRHWKAIIPFEIRANVTDCIEALLPKCKADPSLLFSEDIAFEDFVSAFVEKVSPSGKLLNIVCRTTNPTLRKRIAMDFQGGTLCAGYVSGRQRGEATYTNLTLVACRRVSWDECDEVPMGDTDIIADMVMHLIVNRDSVRDIGVWPGNTIHLLHLCHFAPFLRMYKAVEMSAAIPSYLQDVLFGNNCPRQLTNPIEHLIDPGSANYLASLQRMGWNMDKPQLESLGAVLANIGDGNRTSSLSMVHGPPGTGKTTTILYLLGALMHHSKIGHVGKEQMHLLKGLVPRDDILRCRKEQRGVRILVCASSNKAVENVLERFDRDGIPDGKGGVFRPQAVRIARTGYDHGKLAMYTVNQKALPFDHHIHHIGRKRKSASATARKSFFKECVVVFSTLTSAGGSTLKSSKIPFDVVIVDEVGQTPEPEALIPLVSVSTVSNRCHLVAVGDHVQLPPVALASHAMKVIRSSLHFDYDRQMISIFQRLYEHNRAPCRMLTNQYRMCKAVAEMNNSIFYKGKLHSPLPDSLFDAPYNRGWDPVQKTFARQTFIDTSLLPDRLEFKMKTDGNYRNLEEINIIDEILRKIKELAGPSFAELRNQIAVLVPYRSQVNHMRLVLERYGKYKTHGISRQGFDILVDSVDSMQGSERDIVIFGSTRSNLEQKFGFLSKPNRLNVATSRAKKLQIIIGDLSTLQPNQYFSDMRQFCQRSRPDVALLRLHPSRTPYLLDGLEKV